MTGIWGDGPNGFKSRNYKLGQGMVSPLLVQRLIALPYLVLGGWCLLAPAMVERLAINPEFQHLSTTSALMMGCFGSQAILSGIFAWFSRFTATTFLVYAIALLPFFAFNYWFVFVVPVFNQWMALDFVSNAAMLGLSLWGWRISRAT
jgi:undecaprenyl pyrophosphate phosphatase UppP